MSLVSCKSCGADVSSNAKVCPSCKTAMNQSTASCKTCNKVLNADDIYVSTSYVVDGTTKSRLSQRPCPHCGEQKPFNVAAQVSTGGANEGIAIVVCLVILGGIFFALFS